MFCPSCGKELVDAERFCTGCGGELRIQDSEGKDAVAEEFIGGYGSPNLWKRKSFFGTEGRGYSLYVTNRRILGRRSQDRRWSAVAWEHTVGIAGGARFAYEESANAIEGFEKSKDLEIVKEGVTDIEMKKPPGPPLSWYGLTGHLKIRVGASEVLRIYIRHREDFDKISELMQKFKPQVIRTV
jgi:hypothetical protein